MDDDLTKLSGPELADALADIASSGHVPTYWEATCIREVARRTRELDQRDERIEAL